MIQVIKSLGFKCKMEPHILLLLVIKMTNFISALLIISATSMISAAIWAIHPFEKLVEGHHQRIKQATVLTFY